MISKLFTTHIEHANQQRYVIEPTLEYAIKGHVYLIVLTLNSSQFKVFTVFCSSLDFMNTWLPEEGEE